MAQGVKRYLMVLPQEQLPIPPDSFTDTFLLLPNKGFCADPVLALGTVQHYLNAAEVDDKMESSPDWLFGHINYDYGRASSNKLHFGICPFHFFCPEVILQKRDAKITALVHPLVNIGRAQMLIDMAYAPSPAQSHSPSRQLMPHISRDSYLNHVECLLEEIAYGNIYEANFCQLFLAEDVAIAPSAVFKAMQRFTPNPFSAFYRLGPHSAMIASPEQFLKRVENKLFSYPMKGTARRSNHPKVDNRLRNALQENPKERAENIMITDLVRNDLSKVSVAGTVIVDELCGVYTFPGVHQLISCVRGELKPDIKFSEILHATFPMGSMTGAPKVSAMKIIEREESFCRELFSGSVGYISPTGGFDLNVVIRSLFYNADTKMLSGATGGAITSRSRPESEYRESLTKGGFFQRCLKG
jgi:para-aminobenzoate synthetase component 1